MRRPLALVVVTVLCAALAACGSQLDPETVAQAGGSVRASA